MPHLGATVRRHFVKAGARVIQQLGHGDQVAACHAIGKDQ